jgi:hypothetical protein
MRRLAGGVGGGLLFLLGLLWLLQGTDVVHLRPILCVSNCAYVAHGSVTWATIGAVVMALGVVLFGLSLRKRA